MAATNLVLIAGALAPQRRPASLYCTIFAAYREQEQANNALQDERAWGWTPAGEAEPCLPPVCRWPAGRAGTPVQLQLRNPPRPPPHATHPSALPCSKPSLRLSLSAFVSAFASPPEASLLPRRNSRAK